MFNKKQVCVVRDKENNYCVIMGVNAYTGRPEVILDTMQIGDDTLYITRFNHNDDTDEDLLKGTLQQFIQLANDENMKIVFGYVDDEEEAYNNQIKFTDNCASLKSIAENFSFKPDYSKMGVVEYRLEF